MTKSWPKSFCIQLGLFILCLIFGAFVIDGAHPSLFPSYLLCLFPSLYIMLSINEPMLFLSDYRVLSDQNDNCLLVAGMKIPIQDQQDLAEERYLKVHGDFLRRAKRMLFFWGQLALSYGVLFFSTGAKGGIISLAIAGFVMILSFGRGHLLLALVIQGIMILYQFKVISMATPFMLFAYLVLIFCLLTMNSFSHSYFKRGIAAASLFILIFLFVDWLIPGNTSKWGEKLLHMTRSKMNEKGTISSSDFFANLPDEVIDASNAIGPGKPLSFEQIMTQLDLFEQILLQGGTRGETIAHSISPTHLKNILHNIKSNKGSYSEQELKQLLAKLEGLSSKIENNADANEYVENELDNFKESFNQFKAGISESSQDTDGTSYLSHGSPEIKSTNKNKRNDFQERVIRFLPYLAGIVLLFITYRFVRGAFKKEQIISEEVEELLSSTMKEYKKMRRLFKSKEEEVILSYQLIHRTVEKLYYLPNECFAPPPEILANIVDQCHTDFMNLASIFSKVQYGKYVVSSKEIVLFRRSFKRFVKSSALQNIDMFAGSCNHL